MDKAKKKLPIGISDYKEIVKGNFSYIDKTLFIEEVMEMGTKVILIPRPRRFGKTINLSMLHYFLEKTEEDHSIFFLKYQIWKTQTREKQGKFPVIFLTLKGIKKGSWEAAYKGLQSLISEEYKRHRYLIDHLHEDDKKDFQSIIDKVSDNQDLFENSLKYLIRFLRKHYNEQVIVLIDEYDTPIHDAYLSGYYSPMISFIRNWFSEGLKDNPLLEKAVLTGVLRVSKESVFSGFNNPGCYTVLDEEFSDKFGLKEEEVSSLLKEHEISRPLETIRAWYNGYQIGSSSLYNPWSILQCIQKKGELRPYWVNTSDNELIKKLLIRASSLFKQEMEDLLFNRCITKSIDEATVFKNLENNPDNIWSLFLFSGYLTLNEKPIAKGLYLQCKLKIPNQEVQHLYEGMLNDWLKESSPDHNLSILLESLVTGQISIFSEILQALIINTMSFYDIPADEPERVYHAFVLGLLVTLEGRYEVKSNRESGFGRYDVCLIPKDPLALGIIMEFKKIKETESLEKGADEALEQIEKKQYEQEVRNRGISNILKLGLAFQGKKVFVKEK